MSEENQSREILTFELTELRRRVAELEHLAAEIERQSRRLGAGLESLPMLVEEQRLLRMLIDTLPDHVFVKDLEGRFLVNNPAHLRTMGMKSQEEALGKTDLEVFPEKYGRSYYEDDRQIIETGEPMLYREEPVPDPMTGEERWLSSVKIPLRNAEGRFVGIVGTSRDITEHLKLDRELSVYHAQLEFMVRTRTAELEQANAQLRQEIAARDRIQCELRERLEMETMLGILVGQFVGATLQTVENDIEPALALIGQFMGADHACLSLFRASDLNAQPVYEWRTAGSPSVAWAFEAQTLVGQDGRSTVGQDGRSTVGQDGRSTVGQDGRSTVGQDGRSTVGQDGRSTIPNSPMPWLMDQLAQGNTVHVPYLAELPEAADSERRLWTRAGIQSLLIVPVVMDGKAAGVLAVSMDTEKKEWSDRDVSFLQLLSQVTTTVLARVVGELALHESEARYRALSEVISDYAYSLQLSEEGGMEIEWLNDSIVRITGYTLEEFTGKAAPVAETCEVFNPFFFVHPDDALVLRATLSELAANHPANAEMRIVTKSGEVRWLGNYSRPVWDERQGRVTRALGSGRDITEQKRAEAALQVSERRYRTLFESAADGISIHSLDGRFLEVNQRICERLGRTREELLQTHGQDLQVQPWAGESNLQTLVKTGPQVFETMIQSQEGRRIAVEASVQLMDYDDMPALLVVSRDISVRKRLEAQLLQAQKMDAVGRLAGGLAHDFNNELTVIASYCDFLMDTDGLDEGVKQWARQIEQAAQRAGSLTKRLLAFGGRQILEPAILNLNDIILDMSKMLGRVIGEDVEMIRWLATDLPNVRADRSQVEQIIMNLTVNARQAMPRGGELIVETASVHLDSDLPCRCGAVKPGPYVMLAVSDNGVGMDQQVRDKVFEPFFTTKEQGIGLGLATVYGVTEQSGGHVTVESELGRGSTFRVYLPVVMDEAVPPRETVRADGIRPDPTQDDLRGTETVFLVEDEDRVRVLARRALELYGYAVVEACSGVEALAICRDYSVPIHLLLTDIVMPGGMNGRELAEKLKAIYHDLKVLYMSGYSDAATTHLKGLAADAAFLNKPFNSVSLARKVRSVLDG